MKYNGGMMLNLIDKKCWNRWNVLGAI